MILGLFNVSQNIAHGLFFEGFFPRNGGAFEMIVGSLRVLMSELGL